MSDEFSYHTSVVEYNAGMAKAAKELAQEVEHAKVKHWCHAIARQHRLHAKKHRRILKRLRAKLEENNRIEVEEVGDNGAILESPSMVDSVSDSGSEESGTTVVNITGESNTNPLLMDREKREAIMARIAAKKETQ